MNQDPSAQNVKRRRFWNIAFYAFVSVLGLGVVSGLVLIVKRANTLPYGGEAPHFTATTMHGKPFQFKQLNGKVRLITFFYTHCTDACPLTALRMQQLEGQLKADGLFDKQVDFVSITLDPKRDTLPVLRQFASHFHAENVPGWYFVRATPAATQGILKSYGVSVKAGSSPGVLEHQLATLLIDSNGNIRKRYNSANLNINQVESDIQNVLNHQKLD